MKYSSFSLFLSSVLLVSGCQLTAPVSLNSQTVTAKNEQKTEKEHAITDIQDALKPKVNCGYADNNQPEYQLTDSIKKYVTNIIKSTYNSSIDPQFRNKKYFEPIVNNTFKFTTESHKKPFFKRFQKDDVFEINDKPYVYAGYELVKVITSTCQIFWFERGNYALITASDIKRADGEKLSLADYKFILGDKNIKELKVPKAEITKDKFTNSIKINGIYENNMMLRDWGNLTTGKLEDDDVQLYADVTFYDDWAHLTSAYDEDANTRKLTRIKTNVDCSNKYLGCQLTETVGIEVPIRYLKLKNNGFEIKVSGTKEKVIKVRNYQVKQMLDAIKEFKKI